MAWIDKYRGDTWRAVVRRTGFKSVSKTFPNKAQAEAWARKIESELYSVLTIRSVRREDEPS